MSRSWSLALPLLTVLVVAYALFVGAVPRPVVSARVYGGPTEGVRELALRVEVVERDGEKESAYWNSALDASVIDARGTSIARATHAEQGVTELRFAFATATQGPLTLVLRDARTLLASGELRLDTAHWAARARRRGGWIRGRESNGLQLSVAAERGAFVIGSADPLRIRLLRSGQPAPGVRLRMNAQGARVAGAEGLVSDAQGQARVQIEVNELNPTLRVEAEAGAVIDTGLLVVPGGMHVSVLGDQLRIESAVPRERAFYSLVTSERRVQGGVLALSPTDDGGASATLALRNVPDPAWLVVSSEVDLNSAAAIGWPLSLGPEPAQTFDVADTLLLDGLPAAFEREQARRSRVRWLCAGLIALALLLSAALLVLRVRAAERDIARHLSADLEPELAARIAPRRLLGLIVALLTLALGFVAFALIVAAR